MKSWRLQSLEMEADMSAPDTSTLGHVAADAAPADDALVIVARMGATLKLTLNRPAKKNALSNQLLADLNASVDAAIAEPAIKSIVIAGAGPCFSAGRDTKEFTSAAMLQDQSLDRGQAGFMRLLQTLMDAPKPTIAAVHGFALGGGQAISLACDFVLAERDAVFGNVEMAYGFPAAMNTVLLARHLGRRLGLEIAMTGARYTAQRFYEMGLVNRLAEPGKLEPAIVEFAATLNALEPWSVARTKATYRIAEDQTPQSALHTGNQLNQLLMLQSQTQPIHSGSDVVRRSIGKRSHD